MSDLISRQAAIDAVASGIIYEKAFDKEAGKVKVIERFGEANYALKEAIDAIKNLQSVVLCKDCRHQEKIFHADRRRKDGGYYIYRCELAEDYSHVCFDYESCSWAERRNDATN